MIVERERTVVEKAVQCDQCREMCDVRTPVEGQQPRSSYSCSICFKDLCRNCADRRGFLGAEHCEDCWGSLAASAAALRLADDEHSKARAVLLREKRFAPPDEPPAEAPRDS